jgi:hypothetical protein
MMYIDMNVDSAECCQANPNVLSNGFCHGTRYVFFQLRVWQAVWLAFWFGLEQKSAQTWKTVWFGRLIFVNFVGNGLLWYGDLCKCEAMVWFCRLICANVKEWFCLAGASV